MLGSTTRPKRRSPSTTDGGGAARDRAALVGRPGSADSPAVAPRPVYGPDRDPRGIRAFRTGRTLPAPSGDGGVSHRARGFDQHNRDKCAHLFSDGEEDDFSHVPTKPSMTAKKP